MPDDDRNLRCIDDACPSRARCRRYLDREPTDDEFADIIETCVEHYVCDPDRGEGRGIEVSYPLYWHKEDDE